jgi:hypothetical protein
MPAHESPMPLPSHSPGISAGPGPAGQIAAATPSPQSSKDLVDSHDSRVPHPDVPDSRLRLDQLMTNPRRCPSRPRTCPEQYLASMSCRTRAVLGDCKLACHTVLRTAARNVLTVSRARRDGNRRSRKTGSTSHRSTTTVNVPTRPTPRGQSVRTEFLEIYRSTLPHLPRTYHPIHHFLRSSWFGPDHTGDRTGGGTLWSGVVTPYRRTVFRNVKRPAVCT